MKTAPRFTLPAPRFAEAGTPHIVIVGTLGFKAAFDWSAHAVEFAASWAKAGTPVAIGHAVHGWFDMFEPLAVDAVETYREWVDGMEATDTPEAPLVMPDAVNDEHLNNDAALKTAIRALSEFLTIRKIEGEFRVSVAPLYWTRKGLSQQDAMARNEAVAQYVSADEHGGKEAKFDARGEVWAAAKNLAQTIIWGR